MKGRDKAKLAIILLVLGIAAIRPPNALGQQMSFSVYNDIDVSWPSSPAVYNFASVLDNSWGCSHWSYYSTAKVVSPTNRQATSSVSGLNPTVSLSFTDEEGEWYAVTTGTYSCSCIYGGTASFGGGTSVFIHKYEGRYYYVGEGENGHEYYADSCAHVCQKPVVYQPSFMGPYLWDRGVEYNFYFVGVCKSNYQGSTQRGLCQPPH